MSSDGHRPPSLDSPAARIVAVGIALAGLAFLGWINRGILFPRDREVAANPAEAAYRACVAPRVAQFEAALVRGELTEDQVALFRRRAKAFCADQAQKGRLSAGPSLPGQ